MDGLPGGELIKTTIQKLDYDYVGLHCPKCGIKGEHKRPEDCIRDLARPIEKLKVRPGTFEQCIKELRGCIALME